MIFRRNENKAWLAVTIFVIALLFIIGLSWSLYSQAQKDKNSQRLVRDRLQTALLASLLAQGRTDLTNAALRDLLQTQQIVGQAAIYSANGEVLASAMTSTSPLALDTLQ